MDANLSAIFRIIQKNPRGEVEMMRVLTMIIAHRNRIYKSLEIRVLSAMFSSYSLPETLKILVRAFYQLRFGINRCLLDFSKHVVIDHQRALRHKSKIRSNVCQSSQSHPPKMFFKLEIDLDGFADAD